MKFRTCDRLETGHFPEFKSENSLNLCGKYFKNKLCTDTVCIMQQKKYNNPIRTLVPLNSIKLHHIKLKSTLRFNWFILGPCLILPPSSMETCVVVSVSSCWNTNKQTFYWASSFCVLTSRSRCLPSSERRLFPGVWEQTGTGPLLLSLTLHPISWREKLLIGL